MHNFWQARLASFLEGMFSLFCRLALARACYACLPTVFDLVLPVEGPSIVFVVGRSTPLAIRMHGASLRAVAHQPEVALASWWNNQDPRRLLSQRRTLSSPCSGRGPSTINSSHLSCNLIGHAAIVAWCTSQCIRLPDPFRVQRGHATPD